MKILITGGAGFIGSNYVNDLILGQTHWDEITILDSLTYAGSLNNLNTALGDQRINFIQGDIRDLKLVEELMRGVTTVVHFAAESHVDRSISNPSEFVSTNVMGTHTLLNSALHQGVKKFLHVSTDEVYGSIENGSWTEHSPLSPNSPYSASKGSSDLLALSYWKTYGLPVFVSRCSNNFGPFQFPEKLIPLAVTNLIDGRAIPIYGDGKNSRDWLHVSDHCRALNSILEYGSPGEIYNIGGGTEMNNLEMAKLLIKFFNKDDSYINFVQDRKGHDFRYSVNFEKLSSVSGYAPTKNFEKTIEETIEWYKSNESWWRPLKNVKF